jgi:hypothetical protein
MALVKLTTKTGRGETRQAWINFPESQPFVIYVDSDGDTALDFSPSTRSATATIVETPDEVVAKIREASEYPSSFRVPAPFGQMLVPKGGIAPVVAL